MKQIKLYLVTRYNIYESGSSSKVVAVSSEDSNIINNLEECFKYYFNNLEDYERVSYQQIFIENIGTDSQEYDFVNDKINEFFKPIKP
jgi:methionine salvage enolase-phosphatase E1